jgi:hypothetical protein
LSTEYPAQRLSLAEHQSLVHYGFTRALEDSRALRHFALLVVAARNDLRAMAATLMADQAPKPAGSLVATPEPDWEDVVEWLTYALESDDPVFASMMKKNRIGPWLEPRKPIVARMFAKYICTLFWREP